MLAQYYVFVYIPRTKVEALRKGPSRRDEIRDRVLDNHPRVQILYNPVWWPRDNDDAAVGASVWLLCG